MSSLLIENGARLDHVNSSLRTALDELQAHGAQEASQFLSSKGAKSFEAAAAEAESMWNELMRELLERGGFGAPSVRTARSVQAFGGSGGGGAGAKLLGKAEQSLREAVAYLKRLELEFTSARRGSTDVSRWLFNGFRWCSGLPRLYPTARVHIETPSGPHDKHNLRGKSVMNALRQAGAPNPLELRTSTSKRRLKMPFTASTCLRILKDARKSSKVSR